LISIDYKNALSSAIRQENFIAATAQVSKPATRKYSHPTIDYNLKVPEAFARDPKEYVKTEIKGVERRIFGQLLYLRAQGTQSVFVCYETLARRAACTPRHAIRVVEKLIARGFISKTVGTYNVANIYKFNRLFDHPTYRAKLACYFPALKMMPGYVATAINNHFRIPIEETAIASDVSLLSLKENVIANIKAELLKSSTGSIQGVSIDTRDIRDQGLESPWFERDARTRINVALGVVDDCCLPVFFKNEEREEMQTYLNPSQMDVVRQRQTKSKAAVKEMRCLKLSYYGEAKIAILYPAEAIKWADNELYCKTKQPENPYGLFKSLLDIWCKQHGVKPNYHDWDSVRAQLALEPEQVPAEIDNNVMQAWSGGAKTQQASHAPAGSAYSKRLPFVPNNPYAQGGKYHHLLEVRKPEGMYHPATSWDGAIDYSKGELAVGNKINPFQAFMIELDDRLKAPVDTLPEQARKAPWELMAEALSVSIPATHTRQDEAPRQSLDFANDIELYMDSDDRGYLESPESYEEVFDDPIYPQPTRFNVSVPTLRKPNSLYTV
jgi:predicted transcriptional regulator